MATSTIFKHNINLLLGIVFLCGPISCSDTEFAENQSKVRAKNSNDAEGDAIETDHIDAIDNDGDLDAEGGDLGDGGDEAQNDFPKFDLFSGSDEAQFSPVDIVFAVDTSGSMRAEKTRVEQTMSAFIQHFQNNSKSIDYQLYLMGAQDFSFPDSSAANVQIINEKVSSRDALRKIQQFFDGEVTNPLPLRPESSKQLVIITDDNSSMNAATFKSYVDDNPLLKSKTSVNGFVWIDGTSQTTSTCTKAQNGSVYQELAADVDLSGKISDLCAADWNKLFTDLATEIITKELKLVYELTKERDASLPLEVAIDGDKTDESKYSYDKDTNSVVFTAESVPKAEQTIEIKYH
jgi:hypothetical protein